MARGAEPGRGAGARAVRSATLGLVVLLAVSCAPSGEFAAAQVARRADPPLAAPPVDAAEIPPTLDGPPLWRAPFSSTPKAVGGGFVGPFMPREQGSDLFFLGVDSGGTTRWSVARNPSCTAFAVTRADGRVLVVLLDSDAAPERGIAARRVVAEAYDPRDGARVWGPVDVPGTLVGPGLVFAETAHSVLSAAHGPGVALDAATGRVVADETAGERILHEHDGVVLVERDGTLRAVESATGETLWSGAELAAPEGFADPGATVRYGPRPRDGSTGAVVLEWTAADGHTTYTVHGLRSGEPITRLDGAEAPALAGAWDGRVAVVHGTDGGEEVLVAVDAVESRVLWRVPAAGAELDRVVADTVYLAVADGVWAVGLRTGRSVARGEWTVPVAGGLGTVLVPVEPPVGEVLVALRTARQWSAARTRERPSMLTGIDRSEPETP
ncbi:PQQ-binding-like beta-propeller repeat protein [Thermobifida alba]|uniref:PQQ-binding-like beta-propeller repeat protein n=1 Tax=Thermobifida alba TaxID=53522 RepID=A0ABY4KYN0_THEAE|nr:PQQ-binding-like beta-propeller repeat protein [Thermobifida alba]UPT20532.1 PQQ-binding-like beta-propeller repeat protein [Thermobifida alba]